LLLSPDYNRYGNALYAVTLLTAIDPQVLRAMRDMADGIEAQIKQANSMTPQQEGYYTLVDEARNRFASWSQAWPNTCQLAKADCRQPVEAIMTLASKQTDSHMREIVLNAQTLLSRLP
jgi:hypothetical protein